MSWQPSRSIREERSARSRRTMRVAFGLFNVCVLVAAGVAWLNLPRVDGVIEINRERGKVVLKRMVFDHRGGWGLVAVGVGAPEGEVYPMAWWRENCTPALWLEYLEAGEPAPFKSWLGERNAD